MVQVIKNRKIFLTVSAVLVALSVASLALWGLNVGIDFTGGSLLEVTYTNGRPAVEEMREAVRSAGAGEALVQPTGDSGALIRFKEVDEPTHQAILSSLREFGELQEERFDSIGPSIGRELKTRAIWAIIFVIGLIIAYIAWAFRKVSKRVSSWKYGLVAIAALLHDILIPTGIVAALGEFRGFQVDAFFITAILTILGFSVHDTIVVFDRIRENLSRNTQEDFGTIANRSVNEVMGRSLNTSVALILVLGAIYFLGGATTQGLSLVLLLGLFFGTYSSIFVASPLLTIWEQYGKRK